MSKRVQIVLLLKLGLVSLAILVSLYLWGSEAVTPDSVICINGGCSEVLKSEYSKILDVPVSFLGVIFFSVLTAIYYLRNRYQDLFLVNISRIWVGVGILFTLYLRYIEFAKIGDICMWCWIVFISLLGIGGTEIYEKYMVKEDSK